MYTGWSTTVHSIKRVPMNISKDQQGRVWVSFQSLRTIHCELNSIYLRYINLAD